MPQNENQRSYISDTGLSCQVRIALLATRLSHQVVGGHTWKDDEPDPSPAFCERTENVLFFSSEGGGALSEAVGA